MDQPREPNNVLEFKRSKREPQLEAVRTKIGGCRHEGGILVDQETRSVECKGCKTRLDAFDILWQMAIKERRLLEDMDEWHAHQETKLSDRYDEEWKRQNEEVTDPPKDADALHVWDTFREYFKGRFVSMYRRKQRLREGPLWYGRGTHGVVVSYEYARQCLIPTTSGKPPKPEHGTTIIYH